MQGTAIVMRSATLKSEKADAKSQSAAPPTPAVETATVASPGAKKRSPWMWVGIGALVLIFCIAAFITLRRNRANQPADNPPFAPATQPAPPVQLIPPTQVFLPTQPPPPTFDQFPGPGGGPPNGGPGNGPGGGPPPPPQNASPEVKAAKDLVTKKPRNPDAHLRLSLALWDTHETRPAMDELMRAMELADQNKPDFFIHAAEEYKKREAWVPAVAAYLRLFPIYRNQDMPNDVRDNVHEALYKAAEQKNLPEFGFFDRMNNIDQPLGYIMRGRYALYNGNLEEAKNQLDQLEKLNINMPEARLLKAEIEMKDDKEKAKEALLSLSADPVVPHWIRLMADHYLKTIQ
jgi:hypothetical protein